MTASGVMFAFENISDTAGGAESGPADRYKTLQGLTFAVKDMFAVSGYKTAYGCPAWLNSHEKADTTAPAVQVATGAGASLKINAVCDEIAFSLDGINSHYGTPLNPADPSRIPGGSSSGPASVVAQGLVDFALGTDTAGSTRVPASYCGLYGLRPTHGAISLEGVLPLGPTFDTVGILTATLPVMQKVCAAYLSDSIGAKGNKTLLLMQESMDWLAPSLRADFRRALHHIAEKTGVTFEEIAVLPLNPATLLKAFAAIRGLEAWTLHGQWALDHQDGLSPATFARLAACRDATTGEAEAARALRSDLRKRYADMMADKIICQPTTANLAPLLTCSQEELNANRLLNLQLNNLASFLGLPQLTIPLSKIGVEGLPATFPGLSLVGAPGSDLELLTLASRLQG